MYSHVHMYPHVRHMCVYMCTCANYMYTCAKNVIFREPGNHFLHFPGTGKSFSGNFFQFLSCAGVFQYTDTCATHVQYMCNISSTGCTKTISNKHHCTWVVQYINACATHVQHMCKILLLSDTTAFPSTICTCVVQYINTCANTSGYTVTQDQVQCQIN